MLINTEVFHKALIADIGRTKQPTDESTSAHWACYLLQNNITRKLTDGATDEIAEKAALEKFEAVNKASEKWLAPSEGSEESRIFARMRKLFTQQFTTTDGTPNTSMHKAFNLGMVGPGAAVGAMNDNFVDKLFNSKLTCTNKILLAFYREAIANHKPWRKAERARAFIHGDVRCVKGSNLFFVPKDTIIARTAATEPTLNMFGQKGYGELIERVLLKEHDIDLSVQQELNRWLAMSGSLNGDYATIDLSSASDTIGLEFCKALLPESLFKDLKLLRSPYTMYGGRAIKLQMISTMGNGFTFPLQTLIFANLVLACMIEYGLPIRDIYNKRRYSVFGDDIIVPVKVYDIVARMLSACGFTMNVNKSFNSGYFRESCGGDYYRGVNVRAKYLHECTHPTHVYGLINNLLDWTDDHKVALPNTTSYLKSLVQFRPIPLHGDLTEGIRTPRSALTNRKISKNGNYFYHRVVQVSKKYVFVFRGREKHRNEYDSIQSRLLTKYYHAFHVAVLHGSFGNGHLVPRCKPGCEVYKVVRSECPIDWDFVDNAYYTSTGRRNAFELNFPIRKD